MKTLDEKTKKTIDSIRNDPLVKKMIEDGKKRQKERIDSIKSTLDEAARSALGEGK